MIKISEICSSHYVVSDGENERFISLYIVDSEHWWVLYKNDIDEDYANWFDNKQEAFSYVESIFDET